ncbi:hypothetical protein LTR70_000342 [Exophiala xenobiotica]|uniref:Photolyase/cryptochrome alpha/beta domain-containing protein n=1 Tax=Lithohypha guttulata TaxID=1690604 RepID=A0ABR0KPJ7_9EURO|nr:hypothetical protein LTR24_000045 [Lithohypha guttulata]KAK5330512.1 hypothetical protein LTR70_000342 [Exophiala xenobiotica]
MTSYRFKKSSKGQSASSPPASPNQPKPGPRTKHANASKPTTDGPRVLYWFRTDLRVHDSPALHHALSLNPSAFIPIWTWDPHYVYRARVGPNRWKFLLESQSCLSERLTELNPRQKLNVVREAPASVIPKLVRKWKVDVLVFEKDTDAYARSRDEEVRRAVEGLGLGVKVVVCAIGRTLYDPDELVRCNGGKPTMNMSQTVKASALIDPGDGGKKGEPRRCVPTPVTLPGPLSAEEMDLSGDPEFRHEVPERAPDFNQEHRNGKEEGHYESIAGPRNDFAVVTLEEMGIDPKLAMSPHKGGEREALRLLKTYIDNEEYTGTFEKPKSSPADFGPQSTTLLSPHHHFGTLSVRKFWWDVQDVFEKRKKAGKQNAPPPANFPGQLLFRDMYFGAQAALGYAFAQTRGNKIARFIPWHLQSNHSDTPVGEHLLDGTYNVDDEQAEEYFRRWKEGRTGFPWIDALMRQLKYEGWMHHLGRHSVACFLTRGGCYVSWERGAEVFEEWLIDHETACNVGNWMWLSCTAFFSQFSRMYSPIAFGKKWDPDGHFIRHYVPELKSFDTKYIYEPHKAPIADQKRWGCQITGDGTEKGTKDMAKYPKPMFDFNEKRQFCLDKMKEAYDAHMYGDDMRVMSGEWKSMFNYVDGKATMDETGGLVSGTKKRMRPPDDHEHDDGQHADVGDQIEEEPPRKAAKTNGIAKSSKGAQTKLDGMVTRSKKT